MQQALQVLGSVIPLFLLMAVGAVARGLGILNKQADRTLLDLTVNVLQPCLILDHVIASEALRRSGNLLWSPLIGFISMAVSIVLAMVAAKLWHFPKAASARTFAFVTGVYNYGYIPVPLMAALYGASALSVLFLFNLGVEVAFWIVGFAMFQQHSFVNDWRRALTTPVRAILLAVVINLATAHFGLLLDEKTLASVSWGWPVQVLFTGIHMIGACAIPLPLIVIGATMADFWSEFHGSGGYGVMAMAVGVRNFLCPVGFVVLAWLLPVSVELKETLVVQSAMPAGLLTLLLVRHNGGDVPVALQAIFSTSALALITLPLWVHFGNLWVGLR